ncbi:gliding motility-associated C-terminal domain-containing protein [Flavobacterium gillisiae]|uniref:Gliding motility-associated C-terminal domain-containing protein n=1 Tax=Flavobacterium gillisiae TaxID=150146 RepID=A0A1H3XTT8_9FLAO|nr:T9SS type B sorting domain-containing protein [Flavobacterium gillisiae]SEA02650.1 gliding motility-associated C-terminal domain-containing protein [Flavobacterium gillisiae]
MKKKHRSFLYLLLVVCLSNIALHAHSASEMETLRHGISVLATPPPTPTPQFLYYCLNESAVPLSATASTGGTLRWYGNDATGGTFSTNAPTPSTSTPATGGSPIIFYVTQEIGGVESSPRTAIYVYVNQKLDLYCQTVTPNSIKFDFSNTGQASYTYSYSISGGTPVTGTHTSPSNFTVTGLSEGQTVEFTLTAMGAKTCVTPEVYSCKTTCVNNSNPNFAQIAPICSGDPAPVLANTSPNGITGTWSPATVSNTASGSYVFTPNPTAFPCATTQTLPVVITPRATPTFTTIPTTVCQNATAPVLPLNSNNTPSISGTWSPSTVNTSVLGPVTYTFTANAGQCVVATKTTATITVQANVAPNFASIGAICTGNPVPVLATASPNGITGTWAPAVINNTTSSSYVFTPTAGQCATKQTLPVTITPRTVPNFPAIASFCEGTTAPILDNNVASPNGVSGTWAPATISNTASGSYVFTPNANQCATNQTLNVTVNPRISPGFNSFSICSGSVPPVLQTTSPNGIKGTWSPAIVNNMNTGSYIFTPDSNQCANPETIVVTVIPSNTLTDFQWTVTEAFAENQVVTIIAIGSGGKYLYRLDDGPFQESPIFEYVSSGYHTVTVIDEGGCSLPIVRTNILVIGYPKYFTPNADGYNDRWNIFELQDDVGSKIHIFDRYGKLLKEITPDGIGWDGTYNGRPMPGNDYWFVVEYRENDILKKFKSHFSLKR